MKRAKLYKSIWVNKIKLYCLPKSSESRNLNNAAALTATKTLTQHWPEGISSPGKMALQGQSVLKYQRVKPCKVNYFPTLRSLPGMFISALGLMDKALTLKSADLSLHSVTAVWASWLPFLSLSPHQGSGWKDLFGNNIYKRPCPVLDMLLGLIQWILLFLFLCLLFKSYDHHNSNYFYSFFPLGRLK